MKKQLLIIGIFIVTAAIVGFHPVFDKQVDAKPTQPGNQIVNKIVNNMETNGQPRIQMAILLDTSSSMSGLINQTREQLWQVVNEFAKSKKNGKTPILEVAVYEYGNSHLAEKDGYVRQVTPLTRELDEVSEALFSLSTNGGDEYCGYVIRDAVKELAWSDNDQDIKTIFIAGNEPFTQGPVPYQHAIMSAKKKGITVNTIHAGDNVRGMETGWRDGAALAGGDYMSIDHNHQVAHVNAPQDKRLFELNGLLNKTYVPYGKVGTKKQARQAREDAISRARSTGMAATRTIAKSSGMYDNSTWDLLDAMDKGNLKLEEVKPEQMPADMRKMDKAEQEKYLAMKAKERKKIKQEIRKLSKQREQYVKKVRKAKPQVSTVEKALTEAVRKEGKKKNYEFKSN